MRKFGSWEKTECDECGQEYQVTRAEPRELEKCICESCEIYADAYKAGFEAGKAAAQNA